MRERIETARLVLRQPTADDLQAYETVVGPEDAPREHKDAVAHWRAHGFGPWLIDADGELVGDIEIHYAGPGVSGIEPHEIEIGWTIVEAYRGKGFATEAGRAALDDAFQRAQPNHHGWVVAYIRPENAPSRRVAEHLGMRHEADGLTRSGHPMLVYRVRR